TSFYYSPEHDMGLPVGVEFVVKDQKVKDSKGGSGYKEQETKNDKMRRMARRAAYNIASVKYVLADTWFSSAENMSCITEQNMDFVMALKSNRGVALSKKDKLQGNYVSIETLELEGCTRSVYLKRYEKPVLIGK